MRSTFFLVTYRRLPKNATTLSLWVGLPLLIFNVIVRFLDNQMHLLEYTQPLSEAICVAGSLMLFMLATREYERTNFLVWALLLSFHWGLGLTVIDVKTTVGGIAVCAGVLFAALIMYWAAALAGFEAWPYQLSPLEIFGLIFPVIILKAF